MATVNAANRLPWLLALLLLVAAAIIAGGALMGDGARRLETALPATPPADADTPAETMNNLIGQVQSVKDKNRDLDRDNRKLVTELEHYKGQVENLRQGVEERNALDRAEAQLTAQVETIGEALSALTEQFHTREREPAARASPAPAPLDALGVEDDLPVTLSRPLGTLDTPKAGTARERPAVIWIAPAGFSADIATRSDEFASTTPGLLDRARGALQDGLAPGENAKAGDRPPVATLGAPAAAPGALRPVAHRTGADATVTPRYTIPPDSKLIGGTLWTALLGRIPVNGQVPDPWRFSVLTGPENLAARGVRIPDIEGVVWSGIARGDLLLSCVSGELTSVTFVFRDGRIVNHQAEGGESLGYLSDNQGIPCVSGRLITNAPAYLAGTGLLAALEAGAGAFAAGETEAVVSSAGTINSAVTGNTGQYVLGEAVRGATANAVEWVNERAGRSFDVVYVEPGGQVAINVEVMLPIDYDADGRRVAYGRPGDPYRSRGLD